MTARPHSVSTQPGSSPSSRIRNATGSAAFFAAGVGCRADSGALIAEIDPRDLDSCSAAHCGPKPASIEHACAEVEGGKARLNSSRLAIEGRLPGGFCDLEDMEVLLDRRDGRPLEAKCFDQVS